ncbi:MAG TPA: HAD-IIA family hydrolase [Acidimicrobiales bacterium]|jgi:NagD protein|nr:HAD-IIA family hydrolase [Acidimicrobiales bacterium]
MTRVTPADCWLCDLDGVLIRDGLAIDGAAQFLERLRESGRPFLILTNNSMFTPLELRDRLAGVGLEVKESELWTSALAAAQFVSEQRPGGSAFCIGEPSLFAALNDVGYDTNAAGPDYVILGETQEYSFDAITTAIRHVDAGAHLLATNPEPTGPSLEGPLPACGAVAALVERATGATAFYVGKPNPLMITEGLNTLNARPSSTVIVGDRMETDIVAGIEAGLDTILVLSGVTTADEVERYPFRPGRVVASIADLIDEL